MGGHGRTAPPGNDEQTEVPLDSKKTTTWSEGAPLEEDNYIVYVKTVV